MNILEPLIKSIANGVSVKFLLIIVIIFGIIILAYNLHKNGILTWGWYIVIFLLILSVPIIYLYCPAETEENNMVSPTVTAKEKSTSHDASKDEASKIYYKIRFLRLSEKTIYTEDNSENAKQIAKKLRDEYGFYDTWVDAVIDPIDNKKYYDFFITDGKDFLSNFDNIRKKYTNKLKPIAIEEGWDKTFKSVNLIYTDPDTNRERIYFPIKK